jgi:MFS family permease
MVTSVAVRKWILLVLLLVLNVLSILDRQLLAVTSPLVVKDLGLTLTQYGVLAGPMFALFYTATSLISGPVSDRSPRPRIIALGLAIWSGATLLMGVATSFSQAATSRVLLGLGEAALGPSAISLIADRFGSRQRGLAYGIYYLATAFGGALASLVGSLVEPAFGWRACFYGAAALGSLVAPAVFFVRDERTTQHFARTSASSLSLLPTAFRLVGSVRALQLILLIGVLADFSLGSESLIMVWLVRDRGADFARMSLRLGLITLVAGALGNVLGGMLADRAESRVRGGRLLALAVTQLAAFPFAFVLFAQWSEPISAPFSACFFVLVFFTMSKYGNMHSALQELAPLHLRATLAAIFLVTVNVLGLSLGAFVAGLLADRISTHASLLICAIPGATAAVPCWICWRRLREPPIRT